MTCGCKGRALRADVTDNIPSLSRRTFALTKCIYTFSVGNFKSHLSYPRYTRCASYVLPLNFSGDAYQRWNTSSVSYRDGQLERKVSNIQPDGTEHSRESPLSGYARLPYNAFIYLSSSSRLVYVPTVVRFACFFDVLFEFDENRAESNDTDEFGYHPLHPSKLLHQCRRNSASLLPILSFLPPDGASCPTWLRFVG